MLSNTECIKEFIKGNKSCGYSGHIGFKDNLLYSYNTVICEIERTAKKAYVNVTRYSRTTSKHVGELRYQLSRNGIEIIEVNHNALNARSLNDIEYQYIGYLIQPINKASDFR